MTRRADLFVGPRQRLPPAHDRGLFIGGRPAVDCRRLIRTRAGRVRGVGRPSRELGDDPLSASTNLEKPGVLHDCAGHLCTSFIVQHVSDPPPGRPRSDGDVMSSRNCCRPSARQRDMPFPLRSLATSGTAENDRLPGRSRRERRSFDGCFMGAPVRGRRGPVGARPRRTGHCSNAGGLSAV